MRIINLCDEIWICPRQHSHWTTNLFQNEREQPSKTLARFLKIIKVIRPSIFNIKRGGLTALTWVREESPVEQKTPLSHFLTFFLIVPPFLHYPHLYHIPNLSVNTFSQWNGQGKLVSQLENNFGTEAQGLKVVSQRYRKAESVSFSLHLLYPVRSPNLVSFLIDKN